MRTFVAILTVFFDFHRNNFKYFPKIQFGPLASMKNDETLLKNLSRKITILIEKYWKNFHLIYNLLLKVMYVLVKGFSFIKGKSARNHHFD